MEAVSPDDADDAKREASSTHASGEAEPDGSMVTDAYAMDVPTQKEADKINVEPWPSTIAIYRSWRLKLIDEVVAASARPDVAFTWIRAVKQNTGMEC